MANLHYEGVANDDDRTARVVEEFAHNENLRNAIAEHIRTAMSKGLERKDSLTLECGMRITPHDREEPRA